jgi:hypothetical protein
VAASTVFFTFRNCIKGGLSGDIGLNLKSLCLVKIEIILLKIGFGPIWDLDSRKGSFGSSTNVKKLRNAFLSLLCSSKLGETPD